jgi:electron transfer flavoprotein alpha subunit
LVDSLYTKDQQNPSIWIFLEQGEKGLESVSLELLSKGRELADTVKWDLVGLLIGASVDPLAELAFTYGADRVLLYEQLELSHFNVEAFTHVAFQAIKQERPSIVLLGATPNGRDLAGRLAVRLRTGLNADCTDLRLDPSTLALVSEVTGFGGGIIALLESPEHRPQMSTVRPGVFQIGAPDRGKTGEIHHLQLDVPEKVWRTGVLEHARGEGVDLTQSEVLVCGGRGIEGNFQALYELAELLDGEVGATRPPVDEGHIERERQIGQTGVVCRPKIALTAGISGAFHFVVGIQDADVVIAINTDPEAPIFDFADYCIVADANQLIPKVIHMLHAVQETTHA